ncbi:hypothetical protein QQZ08_009758 [Neonectria magnoliae]|uniref:Transketolase n=1 Tax=Neonectria magnoliae TaxID=2732573 RepID=A0ABR1HLY2_9HYPO
MLGCVASLSCTLQLDNLVVIYDHNQVTCDSPLDWINTEDVNAKVRASGWHVIDVSERSYDVQAVVSALKLASTAKGQPVFINIRTVIGLGTEVAGTFKAHHGVFDKISVEKSKRLTGQDPSVTHTIPEASLAYSRERKTFGKSLEAKWNSLVSNYSAAHPDVAQALDRTRKGDNGTDLLSLGRDPVGPVPATSRFGVAKGAYVVSDEPNAKLTLASCGTNLHYAVAVAEALTAEGIATRIVSAPSFDHFDKQEQSYHDSVFPRDGTPIISVEEYIATTWARYVTASIGMTGYGYSASNPSNYEHFGLDTKGIVAKVRKCMDELDGEYARIAGWRQL